MWCVCVCMYIQYISDISPLHVYGNDVLFAKQCNYLGVILDSEMTADHFIMFTCSFIQLFV